VSELVPGTAGTRDRILEAARELFLRQGYTATGIAQIIREADVRSGSLYYFFPTKEDLLVAVLERYVELLHPMVIDPVCERVADPIERVFGVLDGYRRMLLATECRQGCPIGNLALEMSDASPAARRLIARNFENWRAAVERCLDDAEDRLPAEIDRAALAGFVLTVMEGGIMQSRALRSIEPFEQAVAMLRDYVDRLVADGSEWGVASAARRGNDRHEPEPPRRSRRRVRGGKSE